jgi:hypothetical protein
MATETREVSGFEQVVLDEYGELLLTQGAQPSLTIEADEDVLSRIETEVKEGTLTIGIGGTWWDKLGMALNGVLSGRKIVYQLTVVELTGVTVRGAGRVKCAELHTDSLAIRVAGAGEVTIGSLSTKQLGVEVPGAGRVQLAGQAGEQRVALTGAGTYRAPKLDSQKAQVRLTGVGSATISVAQELEATIQGVGSVEYYGTPSVKERITGVGRLVSLSNP